ncbi:MAG TPA: metallopeptidase TldD-related protein [Candidatus Limnocylindria bacterium]|nr:metallopeptidase TldD-related protein [Candidatus Limnocylindria bacterium]
MDLTRAVREALECLARQPDVVEVEVFAAFNRSLLTRLNYTSHIPCNGVEEPKSSEIGGLGVQAVFDGPDGRPLVGFGSEPSDLTPGGALRALAKARQAAVHDPEFRSLPRPIGAPRALADHHDPRLMNVDDALLVEAGWKVITGGLRAFMASSRLGDLASDETGLKRLGLILGGDVSIAQSRVAIASSAMPAPQADDCALMSASVTGMVEARDAKGSGWSITARLEHFTDEAGGEAAGNAVAAMDGERVPSGDYAVIFGPQPVADLCSNLIVPSCQAGSFYSSSTPFLGRLGRIVAARRLSIYDHGAMPGLAGSRGITCEGLPTGRTDLIKDGVLVGLLSHWYDTQRLLHDPAAREKLGVDPAAAAAALAPRNGFRGDGGSGRSFESTPGTSASNVIVEGADPVSLADLAARIGNGLYVGRIWYTYPINGLRAGDFTCTVVGDSFIIRDGRIAASLRANTIRINDNVTRLLGAIVGTTKDARGTPLWAADEVVYAPAIAVSGVHVDAIAGFMEGLD